MADVGDLTLEAVRDFMLLNGGKVTNHDLVKHFKGALTNPETRVQARNEFKEIVNTVATIVRSDEGEKYLLLKKKYRTPSLQGVDTPASTPDLNSSLSMTSLYSLGDKRPMALSVSQDSLDSATSPTRQPPPYRPPPPPTPTSPPAQSSAPPVPPRKKSTGSNKENSPEISRPTTIGAEADVNESDPENKISVKEGIQKFQRMASESALQKAHLPAFKKSKTGLDKDEDTHSVTSLDPKAREWMVKAAQADYQALFKLASENPKLAKFKVSPNLRSYSWLFIGLVVFTCFCSIFHLG